MEQQSSEQVLTDLGLTQKQARAYIVLAKSGPLRITEISRNAKVARPDVYPALEKLQKLGLVEKIIGTPVKYRAISMDEGLSLLLETKTNQYQKIRAETEVLRIAVKTESQNELNQMENNQFVLIPEGKAVIDRIAAAIESAQQSIDIVLSWQRVTRGIVESFTESRDIAEAKKVKIRCISERPPENETSKQLIQYFKEMAFNQMKFISHLPETIFGIYDKREISVAVVPKTDLQSSPVLWSNNVALISLASNYFEVLWREATEA